MPQLLRGIVRNVLADHRDMRVMREVEDESLVLAAVEETAAQFVIWGIDGEIPDECPRLFQEFPRVRVLANHSCLTAAQHPFYQVLEGDRVVDRWEIQRGW